MHPGGEGVAGSQRQEPAAGTPHTSMRQALSWCPPFPFYSVWDPSLYGGATCTECGSPRWVKPHWKWPQRHI